VSHQCRRLHSCCRCPKATLRSFILVKQSQFEKVPIFNLFSAKAIAAIAGPNTSVQCTIEAASIEQDSKQAIFFDDGEGYLYVRELGVGTQARAILVHSIADGKRYVRKVSHPTPSITNNPSQTQTPGQHLLEPTEVSLYRPYIYIPRLIDFKTFEPFNDGIHADLKQFVPYWQLCNGGDLEGYLSRHEAFRERVPEIITWRFLTNVQNILVPPEFETCYRP
jgi:hypothetical protein